VRSNLLEHPRIAAVTVERIFPNRLRLSVVERSPLVVVYARGTSGRIEAHCVDGSGVVFAPASEYAGARELPVLSGLEIHGVRYGLKLDGAFLSILSSLSVLRESEPALLSAISELRVVTREGSPSELLIYPARYRIPVRVKPVLDAGLLKSILLVLDVVEGGGLAPSIRELDMRTDTYVYRTKEAVSG
jgi:cell division protein FtsQ